MSSYYCTWMEEFVRAFQAAVADLASMARPQVDWVRLVEEVGCAGQETGPMGPCSLLPSLV